MKLKEEIQNTLQEALERRLQAEEVNAGLNSKILDLQNTIDELEAEISRKNGLIAELQQKNALIEDFTKLCKEQQTKLEL